MSRESITVMEAMLKKYSTNFPQHQSTEPLSSSKQALCAVLIVGTRGGLGAELLAYLLSSSTTLQVFALNRSHPDGKSAVERQADEFRLRGLNEALAKSQKLVLLEGDTSEVNFGLAVDAYTMLSNTVTGIIVNGWRVEFSSPLSVFEPLIAGVRNLLDLSLRSRRCRPPRLLFCSSLGLLFHGLSSGSLLEELPLGPPVDAWGQGYRESKWVVEKLLEAADASCLHRGHFAAVRIGQICGSRNGVWKFQEWFPAMLKSSQFLGCVPTDHRNISWIPPEVAARAIVEILSSNITIAHLVHPRPVAFPAAIQPIAKALGLTVVSQSEWLQRLENSAAYSESIAHGRKRNPSIRLLPTLRSWMSEEGQKSSKDAFDFPRVSIQNALVGAPSLRRVDSIREDDILQWVRYWQEVGYLERPARL